MTFSECIKSDLNDVVNSLLNRNSFEVKLYPPGNITRLSLECEEFALKIESQNDDKVLVNNLSWHGLWVYDMSESDFKRLLIDELLKPTLQMKDCPNELLKYIKIEKEHFTLLEFDKIYNVCQVKYFRTENTIVTELEMSFLEGLGFLYQSIK